MVDLAVPGQKNRIRGRRKEYSARMDLVVPKHLDLILRGNQSRRSGRKADDYRHQYPLHQYVEAF